MAHWQKGTDGDGIGAANGNYQYLGRENVRIMMKKPAPKPPATPPKGGKPFGPQLKPGGKGKGKDCK